MNEALLPCPFCGKNDRLTLRPYMADDDGGEPFPWGYNVLCNAGGFESDPRRGCGSSGAWGETEAEAVAAWNRRRILTAIEPVAASPGATMTVIDPDAWEPCTPNYLDRGGSCDAPRVWNEAEQNHWHPKLPTQSEAVPVEKPGQHTVDDGASTDNRTLPVGAGSTLSRCTCVMLPPGFHKDDCPTRAAAVAEIGTVAASPGVGDGMRGDAVRIAHDGFEGDIIGRYVTREGKRGVVVQQHGTRVAHVYGEKWLAAAPASPAPSPAGGDVVGALVELDGVTMTPAAAANRISELQARIETLERALRQIIRMKTVPNDGIDKRLSEWPTR